jgi:hypothetical protein
LRIQRKLAWSVFGWYVGQEAMQRCVELIPAICGKIRPRGMGIPGQRDASRLRKGPQQCRDLLTARSRVTSYQEQPAGKGP